MPSKVVVYLDEGSAYCLLSCVEEELEEQLEELNKECPKRKHTYKDCCPDCYHAFEQVKKAFKGR